MIPGSTDGLKRIVDPTAGTGSWPLLIGLPQPKATPGRWAWRSFGGRLVLVADYASRKVVLASDRKGNVQTCDPSRVENTLIQATGGEPDMVLIEQAPALQAALGATIMALRSFQFGNGSEEFAKDAADAASIVFAKAAGGQL